MAWSDDGLLLAVGAGRKVSIFNTSTWMPEKEIALEAACTDVAFLESRLFLGDESGHCSIIGGLAQIKRNVAKSGKAVKKTTSNEMDVSDDEDEIKPKSAFIDDEAGDDDDGDQGDDDLEALWEGDNEGDEDEPVRRVDDDNTADISLEAIKKQTNFETEFDKDSELGDGFDADGNEIDAMMKPPPAGFEYTTTTKMQSAFQPGSTPAYQAERFLCWNGVGIVKGLIDQEKGISSIVVEFHNIQTHHSIQIQNKDDFTLGALSDTALILASDNGVPETEDRASPERSVIKVMHYKTWWEKNKEWTLELPKGEFAQCVCASSTWVAVATTERMIRVFSTSGAQIHLCSIPGPIVSISANQEQLFYTYHRGAGFDDNQLLSCGILTMDKATRGLTFSY